jgi:hypothetical protein
LIFIWNNSHTKQISTIVSCFLSSFILIIFKAFSHTGQSKWFSWGKVPNHDCLLGSHGFAGSLGHWPLEVYIISYIVFISCWRTQEWQYCLFYTGKGMGRDKFNNENSGFIFRCDSVVRIPMNMNHTLKCMPEPKAK